MYIEKACWQLLFWYPCRVWPTVCFAFSQEWESNNLVSSANNILPSEYYIKWSFWNKIPLSNYQILFFSTIRGRLSSPNILARPISSCCCLTALIFEGRVYDRITGCLPFIFTPKDSNSSLWLCVKWLLKIVKDPLSPVKFPWDALQSLAHLENTLPCTLHCQSLKKCVLQLGYLFK